MAYPHSRTPRNICRIPSQWQTFSTASVYCCNFCGMGREGVLFVWDHVTFRHENNFQLQLVYKVSSTIQSNTRQFNYTLKPEQMCFGSEIKGLYLHAFRGSECLTAKATENNLKGVCHSHFNYQLNSLAWVHWTCSEQRQTNVRSYQMNTMYNKDSKGKNKTKQ